MEFKKYIAITALLSATVPAFAENDIKDNEFNPVNTGVTTLSITPMPEAAVWVISVRPPIPT